jgi:HK97 family phage major capsid protein
MSDIEKLENITHHYRKSLEAYEARTRKQGHTVERDGSGEEREKFAKMDADLTSTELRMQQAFAEARAAEKKAKDLEERMSRLEKTPKFAATFGEHRGEIGTDDYARRYLNAVIKGDQRELRAVTALSTGSDNAAIPTDMERRIVEKLYQSSVIRNLAVVNNVDSKRTISVESALPTTTKVAESAADPGTGTAATLAYPTFGTQISVAYTKYVTPVKMSQEFLEDAIGTGGIGSGLDYVARKCATSMALKHEEQFTIGDGVGDPQGIALKSLITQVISITPASGSVGASSEITGDNVIDTYHACPVQYRSSPKFSWLVSDVFLKSIRKLKTTNGDYIFSPNNTGVGQNVAGLPGMIYGAPYAVSLYIPGTGNGNGSGSSGALADNDVHAVIGDFSYFEIFDRTGITSLIDPYSNAINGQTTLYVYSRTDSRCMNKDAFAALVS